MGKLHLVCSEGLFFSLGQQMPPKAIKRYLELRELRIKKWLLFSPWEGQ